MILAIETSTPHASLALWDEEGNALIWESSFETDRSHNSVIFEPVGEALKKAGVSLSGIVVGLGPGSYSGVRVGIAVANGISLAREVPLLGVSSLEAWDVAENDYRIAGDARRKTFFLATIRHRCLTGEPVLMDQAEAVAAFAGETAMSAAAIYSADKSVVAASDSVSLAFPSAARLAQRAAVAERDQWSLTAALEPHYLRAPYITVPKNPPVRRA